MTPKATSWEWVNTLLADPLVRLVRELNGTGAEEVRAMWGERDRFEEAWTATSSPPAMLRLLAVLCRRDDLVAASRSIGMELHLPAPGSSELFDAVDDACFYFFFGRSASDAQPMAARIRGAVARSPTLAEFQAVTPMHRGSSRTV